MCVCVCVYIYIYIYMEKTVNESTSRKSIENEKHKVFRGMFYWKRYLLTLNVSIFKPTSILEKLTHAGIYTKKIIH